MSHMYLFKILYFSFESSMWKFISGVKNKIYLSTVYKSFVLLSSLSLTSMKSLNGNTNITLMVNHMFSGRFKLLMFTFEKLKKHIYTFLLCCIGIYI